MGRVCVAHHFADVADLQAGILQQLFRFLDTDGIENVIKTLFINDFYLICYIKIYQDADVFLSLSVSYRA